MRRIVEIFALLLLANVLKAQSNLGNRWIIGFYGYQIDFNTSVVLHDTTLFNPILLYESGHSNVCDTNGGLLLCSDGMHVSNHTGAILDGGDTLTTPFFYSFSNSSSRYSQSSIFLPMANNIYYLVTPTANDTMVNNYWLTNTNGNFNLLNHHLIDMNANGGAGKVIKRMQPLLENRWMDKTQMMACRHANGKDWWLLKKAGILGNDSNAIFTFLFTQDSVYDYGIQTIPFPRNEAFWQDFPGQMKFNQSGTQMATTVNNGLHEFYLSDFDRCTGKLNNFKKIKIPILGGDSSSNGLAFSPNGRFLYVTQYTNIYQYDLQDTNQSTAWYYVYGIDTTASEFAYYKSIDLAPDGKMYLGHKNGFSRQMSVIDNPDLPWSSCGFCRKCLRSEAVFGYFGTAPTMPNYSLGAMVPCWPLGINDGETNEVELKLYPNPASDNLTIELPYNTKKAQVVIYSMLGEMVLSLSSEKIKNSKVELSVKQLARTLYSVRINADGESFVSKFLKE
ncbi:hypothetical protein EMGBS15_01050 [Filimonas sp.]|nr:hypothetical protein EMGBS15_01050 [Filimonas sp.]